MQVITCNLEMSQAIYNEYPVCDGLNQMERKPCSVTYKKTHKNNICSLFVLDRAF